MSPPPQDPKKKPAPEKVEGIDLSDFDEKPVAGVQIPEELPPPKAAEPASEERPVKAVAHASPPPAPSVRPILRPPPSRPAVDATPVLPPAPPPPVAKPPPKAPETVAPKAVPAPAPPAAAAAPPPLAAAPAYAPYPLPPAFGYPQAPLPGAPYGAPYPYPYPPAYYPPYSYTVALPAPTRVWATRIGLARVITAVSIGFGAYALEILSKVFEATTGVTDAPGSHAVATLGFNALAFLLLAGKALFLGAAVLAGASGVAKLREGRDELDLPGVDASRRGPLLLAAAAGIPLAAVIASSFYLAAVQATLPGSGMVSDLGLERLWGQYRTVALVNALVGLACAFLLVKGLDSVLPRTGPAAPRAQFRAFATLFVAAAAANAALVLVVLFAWLNPPVVGAQASPAYAYGLLAVGPALALLSLWRLRSYLQATLRDVERRIREKALLPERRPSATP